MRLLIYPVSARQAINAALTIRKTYPPGSLEHQKVCCDPAGSFALKF